MSIIRAPRPDRGFTILDNKTIRDDRISYRAFGVLANILSRPDNWRTNYRQLAKGEGREGQAAVLTALKELEAAGYLVRRRLQDERGRWAWEHYVYDTPQAGDITAGETMSQEPRPGLPHTESCDSLEVPNTDDCEEDDLSWPADPGQEQKTNWRDDDRDLFLNVIGATTVEIDGTGPWHSGRFKALALYEAMRRGNPMIKAKKWPGRYLDGLEDWEDYLAGLGVTTA